MSRETSPQHLIFDPTTEIFATGTGGGFSFPLVRGDQTAIDTSPYDEVRFVFSLWYPSSKNVIDLDRAYTELGLITSRTGQTIFHDRSAGGMIERMRARAASMGADAIIVRSASEGTWGLQGGGHTGFDRGNAEAVAIRYDGERVPR